MRLTTTTTDLLSLLQSAAKVPQHKECVVLTCSGNSFSAGKLAVSGTNMQATLRVEAVCQTEAPGTVVVNLADALRVVKSLKAGTVVVSRFRRDKTATADSSNDQLEIASGKSSFKLTIHDEGAVPLSRLDDPAAVTFQLPAPDLRRLMDRSGMWFAEPTGPTTQEAFKGGLLEWEVEAKQLRLVGSDGNRLAYAQVAATCGDVSKLGNHLIPTRSLELIRALIEKETGEVCFHYLGNDAALVKMGMTTLHIRLMVSQFPKYRGMISPKINHTLSLPADALLTAIRCVYPMADGTSNTIRLTAKAEETVLYARKADMGIATHTIPVTAEYNFFGSESVVIGVNAQYLIDALEACGATRVQLGFSGELSPIIIQGYDAATTEADASALYVVMPIRLD